MGQEDGGWGGCFAIVIIRGQELIMAAYAHDLCLGAFLFPLRGIKGQRGNSFSNEN